MGSDKRLQHEDLMVMDFGQLYSYGSETYQLLANRWQELQDAMLKNPGEYDFTAFQEMQSLFDEGTKTDEYVISKEIPVGNIRAKVSYFNYLKNMETSTVYGAKRVQERNVRSILRLPTTGELQGDDLQKYNEAVDYNRQNPDGFKTQPDAFKQYQRKVEDRESRQWRMSDDFVIYSEQSDVSGKSGAELMAEIHTSMAKLAQEYRDEEQRHSEMHDRLMSNSAWVE